MASLADLASGSPTRARARARAPTHRVHSDVGNVSSQIPHLRGIAQSATWCPNVASLAHVASGSQVAWLDMASRCAVTSRGVREPGGVAKRDVKMWRHLPTWRQGVRWRGWTWRQNVASLGYVASGSQVAWPDVASLAYTRTWRQNVASLAHVASGSQVGVAGRGVKMWRHLPTWRQGATWRRRTWRQNVASGAIDLRGVTGRGVKRGVTKPGLPARVFKMCLQSSGDMCTPTGDHPAYVYIYIYIHIYIYVFFQALGLSVLQSAPARLALRRPVLAHMQCAGGGSSPR